MKETEILEQQIKEGRKFTKEDAIDITRRFTVDEICRLAGNLRVHHSGDYIDTCSIMNARSGKCPENCKWCSQSMFHKTDVEIYPLVGVSEAVELALHNAGKGVRRFSLVTSGRTMNDAEVNKSCQIYREIGKKCDIYLCASMGLLNKEQLQRLYDSGVRRYHCNLETAPSFFANLCTTHTPEDKIQTIRWAQEVGMEVCSGGIIGMGESLEHRIELAVALRDLNINSIPVNVLTPVKGTALEGAEPLTDDEIMLAMAMFRIINPESHIRLAGGRILIKHLEPRLLHSGVSASIVGDMLTTTGSDIEQDKEFFRREGFTI